ncbi:respirasome Complex Assembly Factor 1 isoform X2 [Adelges cooleyi]|uniref:respirasome Complex Assembly Factor 1 isoform X2 n=1 Tax=Adelges cooleyi TaxID=133065 RepID=UPI0021807095|nr:respirasome Complex Assembly Factor 1 isoform X2 [Adelges cooleyi]XP_050429622.1 respirasome Complex Assembly Factor 1 isoform X2 [Adelges cooleyi]
MSRPVEKKAPTQKSIWYTLKKATTKNSEWPDKDEFLDVIYWTRQIMGIVAGILWGLLPLKGLFGLGLFIMLNATVLYAYFTNFQKIDEEEFGGAWELTKEGFVTSLAGFLVMWIIVYSGMHFD